IAWKTLQRVGRVVNVKGVWKQLMADLLHGQAAKWRESAARSSDGCARQAFDVFDGDDCGQQISAVLLSLSNELIEPPVLRLDIGVEHGEPFQLRGFSGIERMAPQG